MISLSKLNFLVLQENESRSSLDSIKEKHGEKRQQTLKFVKSLLVCSSSYF